MKSTRSSDMAVSLSFDVTSLDRPPATNSSGPFGCFDEFAVLDHESVHRPVTRGPPLVWAMTLR